MPALTAEKSNQIWGDAGRRLAVLCISTTVLGQLRWWLMGIYETPSLPLRLIAEI